MKRNTVDGTRRFAGVGLALAALFLPVCASASTGDFYPSYEARVVAHVALPGNAAQQMFVQHEGRKTYLYVRQAAQKGLTVVDVTKPERPSVVNHMPQGNLTMLNSGLAISETPDSAPRANPQRAAADGNSGTAVPELVRVVDVSDPAHPRTIQTFDGVTSILRDDSRNLIYVANADGIWILSHQQVLRRHRCSSSDAISSAMPNCD